MLKPEISTPTTNLHEPVCAGAVNDVVKRPRICPRCGAADNAECGDTDARERQIAEDIYRGK